MLRLTLLSQTADIDLECLQLALEIIAPLISWHPVSYQSIDLHAIPAMLACLCCKRYNICTQATRRFLQIPSLHQHICNVGCETGACASRSCAA